jgi:ADP-ribose pyrophosphatase
MVEKTVTSRFVYTGQVVKLRIDIVETANGRRATREIVEHADCVAVVPVDEQGNILLVRQYRYATGKELLEIPAGGVDPGENVVAAVRREMGEETGFSPKTIKRLGGFYSSPGFCTEYLHLFLATDLVPNRLKAEDTEDITMVKVKPDEVEDLIASEAIGDYKSVAGLLMYLNKINIESGS